MAVAIVQTGQSFTSSDSANTWTFEFGFTTTPGNTVIVIASRDTNGGILEPTPWNQIRGAQASSSYHNSFVFPGINNAAISNVFLETDGGDSGQWAGIVYELSGVPLENPIDASDMTVSVGDQTNHLPPRITTLEDGSFLISGLGSNNSYDIALDGAVVEDESVFSFNNGGGGGSAGVGQTSGSVQLGTAGQIAAMTHTIATATDGAAYSIAVKAESSAPQPSLHTVKLDKQCESTDFALGILAIKNQSTTNEIASSIVSLSNLPTDAPQFNITYVTGEPTGTDTIHLYYDSSTGDIKSTTDGIDLASFTNLLGTTCP